MWLSGLSTSPQTKESPVWFPARSQGCGPGPQLGVCEMQPINVSLPLFLPPSLPLSIKINKILKHKEEDYKNIKVVVIMFLFKLYVSVLSIAPLWKMMTITSYLLFSTLTSSLFAPNFYLYYYFYIFITYFYIFYKVIL